MATLLLYCPVCEELSERDTPIYVGDALACNLCGTALEACDSPDEQRRPLGAAPSSMSEG